MKIEFEFENLRLILLDHTTFIKLYFVVKNKERSKYNTLEVTVLHVMSLDALEFT